MQTCGRRAGVHMRVRAGGKACVCSCVRSYGCVSVPASCVRVSPGCAGPPARAGARVPQKRAAASCGAARPREEIRVCSLVGWPGPAGANRETIHAHKGVAKRERAWARGGERGRGRRAARRPVGPREAVEALDRLHPVPAQVEPLEPPARDAFPPRCANGERDETQMVSVDRGCEGRDWRFRILLLRFRILLLGF